MDYENIIFFIAPSWNLCLRHKEMWVYFIYPIHYGTLNMN
jgi:hypothetical protein